MHALAQALGAHMSILISCFALALSGFTFYWTALRNRRSLVLVRITEMSAREHFAFALVNGGKSDILVTRLAVRFDDKAKQSSFYPEQRVTIKDNSGMLVAAGKATRCSVEFTEPFTQTFAKSIDADPNSGNLHVHPLSVDIQWIEMSGVLHEKLVPHSRVGFSDAGELRMVGPLAQTTNLYSRDS